MLLQLVMIVKDAENTITNTLREIAPFIDYWTVLDTGSSDDTCDIIRTELKNIPGHLYEEEFIDFSTSRNRALDLAGNTCKYTIMLDDSYILHNGNELRRILQENSNSPSFTISIMNDKEIYCSNRILRSKSRLRYKYRVHEVVEPCETLYLPKNVYIYDYQDFKSDLRTAKRFSTYLKIFQEDYEKDPTDSRIVYYLANSYYGVEKYNEAIIHYRERINMEPIGEEVYMSYYMIGVIQTLLHKSPSEIIKSYQQAFIYDSKRAEPLYQIALVYYKNSQLEEAYKYANIAYKIEIPQRDLQIQYKIYNLEIPCILAEICLSLGKKEQARKIIDKTFENNPTDSRLQNMRDTLSTNTLTTVIKGSKNLIVIHSGTMWNPETYKNASGSEIMARNIASELVKRGNRVIIFLDDMRESHLRFPLNGVEYKQSNTYREFINTHYIDVLIVSRFVQNLLYPDGVQRVYLWLHDVRPAGDNSAFADGFQTHKTKFKGVLCLCNWHKQFFCTEYQFPENMVHITRNAIDIERFNNKITKIPFRFIYTTDPNRGLENLLNAFTKIKERYEQATLCLFVRQTDIEPKLRKRVYNNPSIIVHDRVDQKQLAIEFQKSDVWLYPTNFTETYCITALEAQAGRALCATYKVGSLTEIVGNRGILTDENNEKELLNKLFFVLDRPIIKETLLNKAEKWARQQTFINLAEEWENIFNT